MKIIRATAQHVVEVSGLFDLYRQYYHCAPDPQLASEFILNRLGNDDSIIFLAREGDSPAVGFVQLYPSFCSVDAIKILILHDLYVDKASRGKGIGELLMNRATQYAVETGVGRIDLLTENTNKPGQALYEKLGYKKALENFYAYSLKIGVA